MRLPTRLQRPGHTRKHSDSVEVFTWKHRPHCDVYSLINELFPALGQPEPEAMSDLRSGTKKGGDRAHGRLTCTPSILQGQPCHL